MFCVYCEVLDNPITNAHAQHSSTRYAAIKALLVVGLIIYGRSQVEYTSAVNE